MGGRKEMQVKVCRWQTKGMKAAFYKQQKVLSVERSSVCWKQSCRDKSNCTGVRAEGRGMGAEGRAEQQPAWTWQEQTMPDFSNFLLQPCEWKTGRWHQGGVCKRGFDIALWSILTSRSCKSISKWNCKGLRYKTDWKCVLCSENEGGWCGAPYC